MLEISDDRFRPEVAEIGQIFFSCTGKSRVEDPCRKPLFSEWTDRGSSSRDFRFQKFDRTDYRKQDFRMFSYFPKYA